MCKGHFVPGPDAWVQVMCVVGGVPHTTHAPTSLSPHPGKLVLHTVTQTAPCPAQAASTVAELRHLIMGVAVGVGMWP